MAVEKLIALPDIGDFPSVEVIEILVAAGDSVAEEDSLITLESDKATMEIPSPFAGVVKKVEVAVGDKISQGDPVVTLEITETDSAPVVEPASQQVPAETAPGKKAETPAAAAEPAKPAAAPVATAQAAAASAPSGSSRKSGRRRFS